MVRFLAVLAVLVAAGLSVWRWGGDTSGEDAPTAVTAAGDAAGEAAPADARIEHGADAAERSEVAGAKIAEASGQAPPQTADDEPAAARARGRVVDLRGQPIAGARVTAVDAELESGIASMIGGLAALAEHAGKAVTTDAEGGFDVPLDESGPFRLIARHAEHPRAEHRGSADGETVDGIVITLRDGADIRGRVVGVPDGVPDLEVLARPIEDGIAKAASGALVDFDGLLEKVGAPIGLATASLDDVHAFRLGGLDPDARYAVWVAQRVKDAPFKQCTERVDVRAGAHGVELRWQEPLTVTLRVVDDVSGRPIETLDVSAGIVRSIKMLGMDMPIPSRQRLPRREFPNGIVVVDTLDVGDAAEQTVSIELHAKGYRPWTDDSIAAPRQGEVDVGTVRLERAPIVRVRVVAAATGAPIAGAKVELRTHSDPATAVADRDSGKVTGSISMSVSTSSEDLGDVNLGDDHELVATTDAEGRCELTAELAVESLLIVNAEDWAVACSDPFEPDVSGSNEREVALVRGGTVRVKARDGHGESLPRAAVRREGGAVPDDSDTQGSDEDGIVVFERLAPGEHTFKLVDLGGEDGKGLDLVFSAAIDSLTATGETVIIADGQVLDLELRQPLVCSLRGIITLDGELLDGAQLRVVRPSVDGRDDESAAAAAMVGSMFGGMLGVKDSSSTRSDVDGVFEFEKVEVGASRLIVTHPVLAMSKSIALELREGDNVHDVALRDTRLRGRVVGPDGAPVRGARVRALPNEGSVLELAQELDVARSAFGGVFGQTSTDGSKVGADGVFELRGVDPGVPITLFVEARRHVTARLQIDPIGVGEMRDGVEVALAPAGRISVRVKSVDGPAMVRAIQLGPDGTEPEDAPRHSEFVKRGRATLDGLAPGRWRVSLKAMKDGDKTVEPQDVDVVAGELVRIEL